MLDLVNALVQPTAIMIPDEPFAVSPLPWRSAYGLPVALIANQLWIVGGDYPKGQSSVRRMGTLDLHECAMEPEIDADSDRFFLLPVLRLAGLEDSWATSIQALIAAADENWLSVRPHKTKPRFEARTGFARPRSVGSWNEAMDFNTVVEREFSGRILTADQVGSAGQLRSIVATACPPQHRQAGQPCPRCTILWCTDCPFMASLRGTA